MLKEKPISAFKDWMHNHNCILGPQCDCEYNRGKCIRAICRETFEQVDGMACMTVCWAYKQKAK